MPEENNNYENYEVNAESNGLSKEAATGLLALGAIGGGVALAIKEGGGRLFGFVKNKYKEKKALSEIKKEEAEMLKLRAKERMEEKESVKEE